MVSMRKKLVTIAASITMVAGLMPAPALAEMTTELNEAAEQTDVASQPGDTEQSQPVQGTTPQSTATQDADQVVVTTGATEATTGATEATTGATTGATEVLPAFEGPAVLYKLKGESDTWRVAISLDEAKAREAEDVVDKPLDLPELRVEGAKVTVQFRTRAPQQTWPQEWKEEDIPSAGTFEEMQARLVGEDAATYDVCYRVHVGDKGWLGWARNGESAGSLGLDKLVDGLQVVLVAKSADPATSLNPAAASDSVAAGDSTVDGKAVVDGTASADATATTSDGPVGEPITNDPATKDPSTDDAATDEAAPAKEPPAFITVETQDEAKAQDAMPKVEGESEQAQAKQADDTKQDKTTEAEKDKAEAQKDQSEAEKEKAEADKAQAEAEAQKRAEEEAMLEAQAAPSITYQAHVQSIGWQDEVCDGEMAGTSGRSLRMEALRVSLPAGTDGGVTYRAHVQRIGWQDWVNDGEMAGTSGQSLRVEAFSINLTGKIAEQYDVYYRVHIQTLGWLGWAKNGEDSGSSGMSRRMEALEIRLVRKGEAAPSSDDSFRTAFVHGPTLRYHGHVQTIGWQDWVSDGQTAGTSGQSLRVEALEAVAEDTELSGTVELNAHVQHIGWQDEWGSMCGTEGQSLRVEAFRVRLTDELASCFDVYYRVHAQKIGWMGWARNGDVAGTSAMSLRLEAIEMLLVPKGGGAPGSMDNAYIDGNTVSKLGYQNPEGFYQVSSKNVQITSEASAPWDYVTPSRIGVWATREDCVNAFVGRAREYLGTPYVWDYSCAPGVGVDCIGLVYQCAYACGMDLGGGTGYDDFNPWAHWITGSGGWHSHDANNFWDYGKVMHVPLSDRQVGDLISWAGHVAIYLGDDQIIEAYPGSVMYSGLYDHGAPRGCMRLFQ